MTRKCLQCTTEIQFKESQIKKDDKVILSILKNISGSKELAGSHAHNLLEVIKENDAENSSMPPLCVEEIEKLENELKLLEFEETQLQWDVDDLQKRENESGTEYDELFREWKAGQRSLLARNELLHSLNNQNEYYISQNKRLKSPELMNAISGTFKKSVMDPCEKLVFN
uniref:Uncharacterized protein n=1 Tax=Panagrolaimus sp. ES5 TaxID=591445 RepID=A0AC34FC89_9BILA